MFLKHTVVIEPIWAKNKRILTVKKKIDLLRLILLTYLISPPVYGAELCLEGFLVKVTVYV